MSRYEPDKALRETTKFIKMETKYIRFHKDHVVRCPKADCNCVLLRLGKNVININGEKVQFYQCMDCSIQFVCCPIHSRYKPKDNTAGAIGKRIKSFRKMIAQLERDRLELCIK